MTDEDLARIMFDAEGRLTDEGRDVVEHWTHEEELTLSHLARRWTRWILAIDLGGLPALILLTPLAWHLAAAVWLGSLAAMVYLAVRAYERTRSRLTATIQKRVSHLLEVATREAATQRRPRHRKPTRHPLITPRITLAS